MGSVAGRAARGGFLVSSGNLVATAVSAVGGIIVARLLSPDEYGLISVSLIFPLMITGLLDFGVDSALLRFTALGRGVGGYVWSGLAFKAVVALASGLVVLVYADGLASMLGRPYIAPMLRILSLYTFSVVLLDAASQVLLGLGEYLKASLLGVIRSTLRAAVSVALILAGLGVYGAIWGFSIAYLSTMALALAFTVKRVKPQPPRLSVLREMLRYSLPPLRPSHRRGARRPVRSDAASPARLQRGDRQLCHSQ